MKILSFDIEDWWSYDHYHLGEESEWLPRLNNYLNAILDLLDARNLKATFFVLGKAAQRNPEIVRLIDRRGHHIGCHSFSHDFLEKHTPDEVEADTRTALDILENIIGRKVNSYRAPAFSITEKNKWVLGILAEHGIEFDCSIFPTTRSFGGFPSYPGRVPASIEIDGHTIREFPIVPATIFGREIVYSGGGYFRLFPYRKIKRLADQAEYMMTYFHIKDFDRKQPRKFRSFEGESALSRYIKNYYGLHGAFDKFTRLVKQYNFVSVEEAARTIDWNAAPIIRL